MTAKGILKAITPPKPWRPAVIILLGAIVGLVIYIAKVANVGSYLSDDPRTCVNCHVMTAQYESWKHSSHANVATCNDCHVPQDNIFKKYAFKAKDGLYHAGMFTARAEPQVIRMHEAGQKVVKANCIRCHMDQVTDAKTISWVPSHADDRLERQCWECHRETPHGSVSSLSSVGFALDPLSDEAEHKNIVPSWMKKQLDKK